MGILRRLRCWRRWKADLHADSVSDAPEAIRTRHAIVVGAPTHPKWLIFDCPCGAGHRVMLNLDNAHHPRWRLVTAMPMTLIPSVDEHSPAGHCHYIVRNGRINWVGRKDR
ncbi:DUF6527 family protein [Microbacterium xylanilyticum]